MRNNGDQELSIYEVTHRETGKKSYQAATTAEDACKLAGWLIGDCFVNPQKPKYKHHDKGESELLVKIPCLTCPFQYAECRKPGTEECPTRPKAPELQEWLKQATESHLCPYVGEALKKTDYNLGQKWLPMEEAVKELSPKT
ncbi:hypothetical protein LCGC14_0921770 [marine sediment metagenome]|uniref:Uncharacterized protein n=1 Tax=marine sediment metagenome TaxID=412755 RepID=A0A0F9PBB6_9ZZZZ